VLTGDLIGSSRLTPNQLADALAAMKAMFSSFARTWPNSVVGEPEFFRSVSWQVLLKRPELALRLALLARAALQAQAGVDSRVSIGIGSITQIVEDRISASIGEAFVLSGQALDLMSPHVEMTGALPERAEAMSQWLPPITHLCGALLRRWTRRQAELMSHALLLHEPTQEQIANALKRKVAKQTAQEILASAGWRPLMEAVAIFEQTNWRVLLRQCDAANR
jgi:hypothetical protein